MRGPGSTKIVTSTREWQEHEDADRVGEERGPRAKRRAGDQSDGSHVARRDQQGGGQHESEAPGARRVAPGESVDDDHWHPERERLPEVRAVEANGLTDELADRPLRRRQWRWERTLCPLLPAAPWPERLLSGRCEHPRECVGERLERTPDPPA